MSNSKKYDTVLLKERKLKRAKQITLKISKKNGAMKFSEIEGILSTFVNTAGDVRTYVRASVPVGIRTLKGYDEELDELKFKNYFNNRVAKPEKFTEAVEYIEVTVFKNNRIDDYFT